MICDSTQLIKISSSYPFYWCPVRLTRLLIFFFTMISILIFDHAQTAATIAYDTVILRFLDKISARVVTFEAPVGQALKIAGSTLQVIVHTCIRRLRTETPGTAAFLDIWDVKENESAVNLFRGWMFAARPAFSAMEHPLYDVWLVTCRKDAASSCPPCRSPCPVPVRLFLAVSQETIERSSIVHRKYTLK